MPTKQNIDVRILVNNQVLIEYPATDHGPDTDQVSRRYIEVEAGQRFSVQSSFKFDIGKWHWNKVAQIHPSNQHEGILLADVIQTYNHVMDWNVTSGGWELYKLAFGAFETNDSDAIRDVTEETAAMLGHLKVSVRRAVRAKRQQPLPDDARERSPVKVHKELPEDLLKGKLIKNVVELVDGEPVQSEEDSDDHSEIEESYYYHKLPDTHIGSMEHEFIFIYRTHKLLQEIGIIEKIPRPKSDMTQMLEQQEAMMVEMKAREKKLKREIERLRKEKNQSNTSNPGMTLASSLGNERADSGHDNDDDACTEIGPLPPKPKIIVDLTEDD